MSYSLLIPSSFILHKHKLPQTILQFGVHLGVLSIKDDIHGNVQIAIVVWIGFAADGTRNLLTLAYRESLTSVEDGLLPMRILGKGSGRKSNWLVYLRECAFKVSRKAMDVVIALSS